MERQRTKPRPESSRQNKSSMQTYLNEAPMQVTVLPLAPHTNK
jgi:hypothetical protein